VKSELPRKERFMREAVRLARRAKGRTRPNPQVGAVVVKRGEIVGRGYHKRAGLPHAEIEAMAEAGRLARGAELYVTLEPCVHHGRTPPCVDAIVAADIKKVCVGTLDPNPRVNGKGVARLRRAGVEVEIGILADRCRLLNDGYNVWVSEGRPHVTLKIAASLDGSIADFRRESKWITSDESRRFAHKLRAASDAVLVGVGTVLSDDPLLTARGVGVPKGQPLRVVLDSRLRVPERAKVLNGDSKTLLVCSTKKAVGRRRFRRGNVEVLQLGDRARAIDLRRLLKELARREVQSLLVEGGAGVFSSFISEGIWDRIYLFCAPVVLGRGISWTEHVRFALGEAVRVSVSRPRKVGPDYLFVLERGR